MGVVMLVIGIAIGAFFGYCEARDIWYLRGRKDGYKKGREDAEWHYSRTRKRG